VPHGLLLRRLASARFAAAAQTDSRSVDEDSAVRIEVGWDCQENRR